MDGLNSEVSFVIHPNFKHKGYGRDFTEFSRIVFSSPYFIVSHFNKVGLIFFRKLDLECRLIDDTKNLIFEFPSK